MSNLYTGKDCQSCLFERAICQQEGKCLNNLLFNIEDVLHSEDSLQNYYEEINSYYNNLNNYIED